MSSWSIGENGRDDKEVEGNFAIGSFSPFFQLRELGR
jgi:hypothetical protein